MNSDIHPNISRIAGLLAFILLPCLCLISCSTAPCRPPLVPAQANASPRPPSKQWVQVSFKPATWYPRGTPTDCPTDHWNGEWIYTANAKSTRFFIPNHGLSAERRDTLLHEALAVRDVIDIEDRDRAEIRAKQLAERDNPKPARGPLVMPDPGTLFFDTLHAVTYTGGMAVVIAGGGMAR